MFSSAKRLRSDTMDKGPGMLQPYTIAGISFTCKVMYCV